VTGDAGTARPIADGLFTDGPDGPRLVAGRCAACEQLHFPRGTVCPYCAGAGCTARAVGPDARLWLYTAVTTRPPGYRGPLPFGFGVVELPGGLRLVTRLTEARLDRLRPGLPMRLVLEPLHTDDDGRPVVSYAFRPEAP
jgi:uncharacterized OB-fold protein